MFKRFSFLFVSVFALLLLVSCRKDVLSERKVASDESRVEIEFTSGGFDVNVDTKAISETRSDNLNSFKVSATTGSSSESLVWNNAVFSKSGSSYKGIQGGKFWPTNVNDSYSNNPYHFYASNSDLTFAAGGTTVAPIGTDIDIVCAYLASPTYLESNQLTFEHIFGRISTMTVSAASGYTLSNISITLIPIVPRNSGTTYNLKTKVWSNTQSGSSISLANSTVGTKNNDILLVPGDYTLTASYQATKGNYVENISKTSKPINIPAGRITSISCSLGGNATEIEFTVQVTQWSNNPVDADFE